MVAWMVGSLVAKPECDQSEDVAESQQLYRPAAVLPVKLHRGLEFPMFRSHDSRNLPRPKAQ